MSENTNKKMNQYGYIDKILQTIVKSWFKANHDFVLKENGDSRQGPGKYNIIQM